MIKIKQYKADASQLNDTPIITMFKIDLRCCQTIIQGVLQSSQPPLKGAIHQIELSQPPSQPNT